MSFYAIVRKWLSIIFDIDPSYLQIYILYTGRLASYLDAQGCALDGESTYEVQCLTGE